MALPFHAFPIVILSPLLSAAPSPAANHHAVPSILTEFSHISPGNPMRVLVNFKIEHPWHLYFDGLNDTGQPPTFTWTLPKGWTVTPDQFPVPKRNVQPGDIVDYIYEDSLTLGFTVNIPKDAVIETAKLSAAIQWLECSDRCLFGSGEVSAQVVIQAPIKSTNQNRSAATLKALEAFDSQLPKQWADAKDVSLKVEGNTAVFESKTAIRIEYFPGKASSPPLDQIKGTSADGSILRVAFGPENSTPKVDGILAIYRTKGSPADYYRLPHEPAPVAPVTDSGAPPIKKGG